MPVEMYNFFQNFIEAQNSCCAPRFHSLACRYKIVDSQTLFTRSRKFQKGRIRCRTLHLRLGNPDYNV